MSQVIDIATLRPQLRPDVVLGPPTLRRGVPVHYIKDRSTNWFYRIGAREYFLVSRMDGHQTLQEIGAEYETQMGKRLSSASWTQVLSLLEKRQLLVGSETPEGLKNLKNAARKKASRGRGIFRARIALVNPDAFLERVIPWLRFAFHPAFVWTALAAIVALEIFFFTHLTALFGEIEANLTLKVLADSHFLFPWIAFFIVLFATHELAHGLACKRFGGSVQEIGIGWRYLSPFPYCKLDDVVLFQNRWHRVYTAFAGVFINLLTLLPFSVLWLFVPPHGALSLFSAYAVVSINFFSLINLLPFLELDGYLMINYALNMADLRKDAYDLYQSKVTHYFWRSSPALRYPQRSSVYHIYGAVSFCVTVFFVVYMAISWFGLLRRWVGNVAVWPLALALALILVLLSNPGRNWLEKKARQLFSAKRRNRAGESEESVYDFH